MAKDKETAKRKLEALVRAAERGETDLPDREAGNLKLADCLKQFEGDLAAGLASRSRKRKRPAEQQVKLAVQRIRDVLTECKFDYVSDLDKTAQEALGKYLDGRVRKPRKSGGISHQTATFYLAAMRRFTWWLSEKKRAPVRAGLFNDIPNFEPDNHRIHARRSIDPEELARVLESARAGTAILDLTGEDRFFLYLTAFATGFRVSELASLRPEDFDLETDPTVRLSGRKAKNRKASYQPLPPGAAVQLEPYLAGKPKGSPVWPGRWVSHAAKMLRVDLAAANVEYEVEGTNGPEFADFHALRHSFLSALAARNVGPKVLQDLARHSTARLTLERYTHTDQEQLAGAVALLPIGPDGSTVITREQLISAAVFGLVLWNTLFGSSSASQSVNTDATNTQESTDNRLAS